MSTTRTRTVALHEAEANAARSVLQWRVLELAEVLSSDIARAESVGALIGELERLGTCLVTVGESDYPRETEGIRVSDGNVATIRAAAEWTLDWYGVWREGHRRDGELTPALDRYFTTRVETAERVLAALPAEETNR